MTLWASTGRDLGQFWSLTLTEIELVLDGETKRRRADQELAYYQAYVSGLLSQPYRPGRFPKYEALAPSGNPQPSSREALEAMQKQNAMTLAIAMGGTVSQKVH